jgi:hypothetical protein
MPNQVANKQTLFGTTISVSTSGHTTSVPTNGNLGASVHSHLGGAGNAAVINFNMGTTMNSANLPWPPTLEEIFEFFAAVNNELYLVDNLDTGLKGVYGFKEALNIYSLGRRAGNKVSISILKDSAAKVLYAPKDTP